MYKLKSHKNMQDKEKVAMRVGKGDTNLPSLGTNPMPSGRAGLNVWVEAIVGEDGSEIRFQVPCRTPRASAVRDKSPCDLY